jgi:hypothetical protein
MLAIDKIESLFGDNYLIKSKKVNELVQTELINYSINELPNGTIHHFTTNKTHKVGKAVFNTSLHATQLKSGVWWIQL